MKNKDELKELMLRKITDNLRIQSPEPDACHGAEQSLGRLMDRIGEDTLRQQVPGRRRRWIGWAAASAALLLICTSAWIARTGITMEYVVASNTTMASESITLEDGTVVNLNARTKLIYPRRFHGRKREVFLVGEGYFEVAHDSKHPFIVRVGSLNVRVVGTRFNIEAYTDSNEVTMTLLEGSVEVSSDSSREKVTIVPNQRLRYNVISGDMHLDNESDALRSILWTKGIWVFEETGIIEICARLEHIYGVKIIITNTSFRCKKYTGELHNGERLEDFLDVIRITTPFDYERDGDIIYIY